MTVQAGKMLVEEIAPRIRKAIPRNAPQIGHEDVEELVPDAIVIAAQMLSRVETQGKQFTAGNIAYFACKHIRSGRRSTGSSKLDVMAPQAQLCGNTAVHSLDEEFGVQHEDFDGPATLGEMLAGQYEDPSQTAARNLDWAEFLGELDERQLIMLGDVAVGEPMGRTLRKRRVTYENIRHVRRSMADEAKECFGDDVLAEVGKNPRWWGDLNAARELVACRAESRQH